MQFRIKNAKGCGALGTMVDLPMFGRAIPMELHKFQLKKCLIDI
jgi:hypothetical protein